MSIALDPEGGKAVVRVADSVRGISLETLTHVFDRFYRVDKARSRSERGAGLGTTFTLELPAR